MIGEEAGPELTLERRHRACDIHVDAPRVLGEVLSDAIKAVFIECRFVAVDQALDLGVLGLTRKLPMLRLGHLCLIKALEALVLDDFAEGRVLHAALGHGEILLQLVDNVCKAVEFSNWLWLHNDAKLLIDDLRLISAREEHLVELTREQVINCLQFFDDRGVRRWTWNL